MGRQTRAPSQYTRAMKHGPKADLTLAKDGTERCKGLRYTRASHLMIQEIRKMWTPERACIIRVMLPGVAQARPPLEYGGEAVPQGHQMGFTPYLTAPGHTGLAACMGSVLGLERLDIVRHSVTPAHVKTRCEHEAMPLPGASGQAQPVLPCRPGNAPVHKIHWGERFISQLRTRRQAISQKNFPRRRDMARQVDLPPPTRAWAWGRSKHL